MTLKILDSKHFGAKFQEKPHITCNRNCQDELRIVPCDEKICPGVSDLDTNRAVQP